MPRKTSQAVKKDTAAADAKTDGPTPRRSGRAVTKQETTSSSKDASRSRRSSTAAQTAASVADSRTPKGRSSVGSRRESTSPSDGRTRTGRDGAESPVIRVKSARRSTSRINYKESDGEEEAPTPKYDENFDSGDNLEESESDEKSKPQGRGRASRAPARGRTPKQPKATSRGRRGRPVKKKEDEEEESETVDVSDGSAEVEEVPTKKGRAVKEKEPAKPARSRRQRSEVTEVKSKPASEARPSRRSGRASLSKEESPAKKRPSRSVQAKKYTEEEDDDIEEIIDTKPDGDADVEKKETDSSRKRKRGSSPDEANKRLKEAEDKPDDETDKKDEEKDENDNEELNKEKSEEKPDEEPMEVDESDSGMVSKKDTTKTEEVKAEDSVESKMEDEEECEEKVIEKKEKEEPLPPPKEKVDESSKQESVKSSEDLKESMQTDNVEPEKVENSASSDLEDSQDVKESTEDTVPDPKPVDVKMDEPKEESLSQSSESPLAIEEDNSEDSKSLPPSVITETKPEKQEKVEPPTNSPIKKADVYKKDVVVTEEKKPLLLETPAPTPAVVPLTTPQTKEPSPESSLSGAQKNDMIVNAANEAHSAANANFEHTEKSAPKANGAHNDIQHTNSTPSHDQYYLPGRKYVSNSKLSDNLRQAVKSKTFGFVSYNLGTPNSDAYLQKEKLLNELNKLDAHVICLQQVAKPFYNAVLEPSLDALGFKSVFSQPEDSLKGMATFYKSSLFRLSGKSDIALKSLIEKELETLDPADRSAVRSHIRKCGNVLFTHFTTVIGTQTITVANVQIPPTDLSIHALQVSCLAREVVRINGGSNKPLLLGGEFNIAENDASYQLLRDGYLSNEMIEELQRRKDVALPEKENASLVDLLWKAFQHPSSNLCSCYTSVLDHEFFIPELKRASSDLLWYSSGSLHTVGVLDVVSDKPGDHHFSLKADVAFSV